MLVESRISKVPFKEPFVFFSSASCCQTLRHSMASLRRCNYFENEIFRANVVIHILSYYQQLNQISAVAKIKKAASLPPALVGMTGFEPAASSSRTKRATGLRSV